MDQEIKQLCKEPVFRYFYEICQIPHGSGNEGPIGDYLHKWAKDMGFDTTKDEAGNVLVRKGASPGYEDAPVVMLQAHMDMVCEKAEGVEHDFLRDPICWQIDGDELSTGGRTTLGADDGIGMALAMALLSEEGLRHPALEVLFTTMEEEDLSGAACFDTSAMKATYLINLDHVQDDEILCGSCGGMQVDVCIPVISEEAGKDMAAYLLRVNGLKGGHSGEDIHRGRDNANIILLRFLLALESVCDFRLGPVRGGSFRLAIPRDAEAMVWFEERYESVVRERFSELERSVRNELPVSSAGISISLEAVGRTFAEVPDWAVQPGPVLDVLSLLPDGIYQMSEPSPGVVDTSDNLGEVYLDKEELHCILEIRSASEGRRTYLFQRIQRLAALLGGKCRCSNAYPSWIFRKESRLRQLCGKVYQEMYGSPPKYLTVHAGLEVGCFFASRPDLDAVSIGPNCRDFHSPGETLQISSVRKELQFLRKLLGACTQMEDSNGK